MAAPAPCIVTYRTWTNSSSRSIQERFEPLPNFVPKRTYKESKTSRFTHEVRRPKDEFSLGEVLVMDSTPRPKSAVVASKRQKHCDAAGLHKKQALVRPSNPGLVEGRCEQMARPVTPRGQWLHTVLKPEAHYTGPRQVPQARLSLQARKLKEFLAAPPLELPQEQPQEPPVEENPPISHMADYISTDGKDVITAINNALDLPAAAPPAEPPAEEDEAKPVDTPPATLDEQIQQLEERIATMQKTLRKTEYQAEFTFGNSMAGRAEMVASMKPKHNQAEFFL